MGVSFGYVYTFSGIYHLEGGTFGMNYFVFFNKLLFDKSNRDFDLAKKRGLSIRILLFLFVFFGQYIRYGKNFLI